MLLNQGMLPNDNMLGAIEPIDAGMLGGIPPVGDNYNAIKNMPTQGINPSAPPIVNGQAQEPMPQQPMTGMEKFQGVIDALKPLSEMIDDENVRSVLPAEQYLKYKKEKEDQKQNRQNQLLDSMKLESDLKFRREQLDIQREENQIRREALLRGDATASAGSSYMQDAKLLMQSDPSLDMNSAYALARSGLPRGAVMGADGNVVALPNFTQTVGEIEGGIAGAKKTATDTATANVEKIQAAPKILSEADLMIKTIDETLNHPGLSAAVGFAAPWSGSFGSYLDPQTGQYVVRAPSGTDAKSFESYLNQLGGQGFLQAYESLRGAAGITNIEGGKAQAARGRLNPTQKEEDFKQALKDLRDYAVQNREKAQKIIQQGGATPTPQGSDDIQSLIDMYGQ